MGTNEKTTVTGLNYCLSIAENKSTWECRFEVNNSPCGE